MKRTKSVLQVQLLLLLLFFPALLNAQTIYATGGTTQAANNGQTFEWAGPTQSTVTVQYITSKNESNEELGYHRVTNPTQTWGFSGTDYAPFDIQRSGTVDKASGRLANTTGDNPSDYPFWAVFTFSNPVPANEIFIMLHDADRSGTGTKPTGHIWINKNRNGTANNGGTASNTDFQRMRWDNSNKELVTINSSTGEIHWDFSQTSGNANEYIALAGNKTATVKRIVVETENISDDIEFAVAWLKPSNGGTTLPVVLHQFNALRLSNGQARVSWDVSETGNDVSHYELERSTGVSDPFSVIANVAATGLSRYQVLDNIAAFTGVIYYRLKMLETDGSFKYSPVVAVSPLSNVQVLKALPNPATDRLTLVLESATTGKAFIQLINPAGQSVLSRQLPLIKGPNLFDLENLGRFARGTYFLKTLTDDGQITETKTIVLK